MCFDGIEGKKLADEVVREKGERKKENKKKERGRKRALWNVLEFGGSGREKREGNMVHVWRRKKKGEKKGEKKKKEMLSHYFHNTFIINLKW